MIVTLAEGDSPTSTSTIFVLRSIAATTSGAVPISSGMPKPQSARKNCCTSNSCSVVMPVWSDFSTPGCSRLGIVRKGLVQAGHFIPFRHIGCSTSKRCTSIGSSITR